MTIQEHESYADPRKETEANEYESLMDLLFAEQDKETSVGGKTYDEDIDPYLKEELQNDEDDEDDDWDDEDEYEKHKSLFEDEDAKESSDNDEDETESSDEDVEEGEDDEPAIEDLDDLLKDLDDDAVVRIGDKALNVKNLRELSEKEELLNKESDLVQSRISALQDNIEKAEEVVMRNALTISNKWNGFDKGFAIQQRDAYAQAGNYQVANAISARIVDFEKDSAQLSQDEQTLNTMKSFRQNAEDEQRLIKVKNAQAEAAPMWSKEFGENYDQQTVIPAVIKFAADSFKIPTTEAANLLSGEGLVLLTKMMKMKEGKALKDNAIKSQKPKGVKRSASGKASIKGTKPVNTSKTYKNEAEEFAYFSQFL